jgi:MFS family permease
MSVFTHSRSSTTHNRVRGRLAVVHAHSVRRGPLWRNPDFMKLWAGQAISELGSRFTREGLPLVAVISLGATTVQTGLLAAASTIPVLVLALVAGVWVDRVRRRPVLVSTDLARAAVLLVVPVGAWLGFLRVELLFAVAVVTGALTVFFDVAYRSYLPVLVSRQHLVEGNSKLAATDAAAEVGGPALVGALIQVVTAPVAILVDALSYLWSALAVGLIRHREPVPSRPQAGPAMRHEVAEGTRAVLHNPVLRALAATAATRTFFGGFYAALYALYVIRELHFGPAALGLAVAAGGAGDLIGALVAGRTARRFGLGRTLVGTALVGGSVELLTPLAFGPLAVALTMLATAQLVGDLTRSVYLVHETSLRQTVTPDRLLGRVNASTTFVSLGMLPVGAVTAGVTASQIGARATLLVAALGMLASTGWLLDRSVRRLDRHAMTDTPAEQGLPVPGAPQ